jgi:hypothetical protein
MMTAQFLGKQFCRGSAPPISIRPNSAEDYSLPISFSAVFCQ